MSEGKVERPDALQSARAAIKGMASIIHEQRRELGRLHRERDYAVEQRLDLVTRVGQLEALKHHTPECHISTCPELEGCEERDGGIDTYMTHDCTCGLDDVRRMVYMRMLRPPYYATVEEEQAANRAKLTEASKFFSAS